MSVASYYHLKEFGHTWNGDKSDVNWIIDCLAAKHGFSPNKLWGKPFDELALLLRDAELAQRAPLTPASDPAPAPADLTPSSKKSRRGRVAGVNKINLALTELSTRLKSEQPVGISDLARAVGCDPDNLKRSKRFMENYKTLVGALVKAKHWQQGLKVKGDLEAWTDPRDDCDED